MRKSSLSLLAVCTTGFLLSLSNNVLALPGMNSSQAVTWLEKNPVLGGLKPVRKLTQSYPDYNAEGNFFLGRVAFSLFLGKSKLVESESIDYRPNCERTVSTGCQGLLRFEKSATETGHQLIQKIYGKNLLNDFLASKLIDTYSGTTLPGTHRWYEGSLYNYSTWHYLNYQIVHFSVVSKKHLWSSDIKQIKFCDQRKNRFNSNCIGE
jgi:hypothetical protein